MKKLSLVVSVLLIATALWLPAMAQKKAPQQVDIKAKAVKYIEYLAGWKFKKAAAMQNQKTQDLLPADKLGKQWHELLHILGPYRRHYSPSLTKDGVFDVAVIKIKFQNFIRYAHVYFDPNGNVAGVKYLEH